MHVLAHACTHNTDLPPLPETQLDQDERAFLNEQLAAADEEAASGGSSAAGQEEQHDTYSEDGGEGEQANGDAEQSGGEAGSQGEGEQQKQDTDAPEAMEVKVPTQLEPEGEAEAAHSTPPQESSQEYSEPQQQQFTEESSEQQQSEQQSKQQQQEQSQPPSKPASRYQASAGDASSQKQHSRRSSASGRGQVDGQPFPSGPATVPIDLHGARPPPVGDVCVCDLFVRVCWCARAISVLEPQVACTT